MDRDRTSSTDRFSAQGPSRTHHRSRRDHRNQWSCQFSILGLGQLVPESQPGLSAVHRRRSAPMLPQRGIDGRAGVLRPLRERCSHRQAGSDDRGLGRRRGLGLRPGPVLGCGSGRAEPAASARRGRSRRFRSSAAGNRPSSSRITGAPVPRTAPGRSPAAPTPPPARRSPGMPRRLARLHRSARLPNRWSCRWPRSIPGPGRLRSNRP